MQTDELAGRLTQMPSRVCIGLLALALCFAAPTFAALPSFEQVRANWRASEAHLLDRHGELVQEIRVDPNIRRTAWTPLGEISPALIAAVLHAEDQRFFAHAGVDWLAAGKAAISNSITNWTHAKPRGASTLTMQLAGLLDAQYQARGKRRDVGEKWLQMQAAQALEKNWRKTEILEAYLNLAPFRGELTGIDTAARGLFDKRPAGLSDSESLILAALIRSPNAKPSEVARRACALAAEADCAALKARTLNALSGRYPIMPAVNLAPHLFQHLTRKSVGCGEPANRIDLPGRNDAVRSSPHPTQRRCTSAGIESGVLRTTLDAALQRHVQTTLAQQLEHLAARNVQDAAALVVDNASGAVLAYVSLSSRNSGAAENDGVQAQRQAGSTLKPFLYGLAFEKRLLTAASQLQDAPLSIATGSGQYTPENYDHAFRGLVSARIALASSLNIPAVQTLRLTGLDPFAARLGELGFSGLTEAADFYGYALALGSLDVRLAELVNAYRSLANGGLTTPLLFMPGDKSPPPRRVQSAAAAFLVADILADREARALTFGLENPLATRYWTAVKTGTSKDMRDNWCIGFSRRYTTGIWVGNFNGSPMHDVSGISGAAPAWAAIMDFLHQDGSEPAPQAVAGLLRKHIQPAGEAPRREWFIRGTEPVAATWPAAQPMPEIVHPSDGMILALDPDIPAARQQLRFRASSTPPGATWQLNDSTQESADWPLTRGKHRLSLIDASGRSLDQVEFEVR
jgi:penicillin-binding protein 1C